MMDTIPRHQATTIASVRSDDKVRRYYRREQKLRIVEETFAPGASVSVIARKYDVNANIVFAWRRKYKRGQLGVAAGKAATLLPILVRKDTVDATRSPPTDESPIPESPAGHIEIHLSEGRWIHISGPIDVEALRTVIGELTRP